MDNQKKKVIQEEVIDFFKSRCHKTLFVSSKDCCSEMARVVGYSILKENKDAEAYILKGKLFKDLEHDILAVVTDDSITLIDPTIWQIFQKRKNIFVGGYPSLSQAIRGVQFTFWSNSFSGMLKFKGKA